VTDPTGHFAWKRLVDYWLGDTDPATTEAIDEHLMHCDACGERFDAVVALGRGTRGAFARGQVAAVLSAAFVDQLKAAGVRVREYLVPRNGGVNCTVTPEDELLVGRMRAPLAGVQRVDALVRLSLDPGREERLADLPFDPQAGEVVLLPRVETVRGLPSHELQVRLLAVGHEGEREIGRYAFRHRAPA
jgi:hypothetical protein